jgi:hypothetical protein
MMLAFRGWLDMPLLNDFFRTAAQRPNVSNKTHKMLSRLRIFSALS